MGVDALGKGTTNMFEQGVFESAASKRNQLQLATQVVKMILKIDDVIAPAEYDWALLWVLYVSLCYIIQINSEY